jgi:glutamyl-tRNA synthetase
VLEGLPVISHETAEQPLRGLAEELGISAGQLFGILRAAVTGQTVSPPLLESMEIIGKAVVLQRICQAADILESIQA